MKARVMLESATFDPARVKILCNAFDAAWERIAPQVGTHPKAIEAARLKLAETVMRVATGVNRFDAVWLADTVINLMLAKPTRLRQRA
jgi:hypothetical protein